MGKRWQRFRMVISVDDKPYLVRYRLLSLFGYGLYLHHILRSDTQRELHDHPWNFVTFLLWGSYVEENFLCNDPKFVAKSYRRRMWSLLFRKATDFHRLELQPGKTVWTLFFSGRKIRKWGFQTDEGWVPYDEYEDLGTYS